MNRLIQSPPIHPPRLLLLMAATALLLLYATPLAGAETITIQAKPRQTLDLGPVRSPCDGGPTPTMAKIKSWTKTAPKLGRLTLGPRYKQKSKTCKGKPLWMKKLRYTPNKNGTDQFSIKFPDAGLIKWIVRVK